MEYNVEDMVVFYPSQLDAHERISAQNQIHHILAHQAPQSLYTLPSALHEIKLVYCQATSFASHLGTENLCILYNAKETSLYAYYHFPQGLDREAILQLKKAILDRSLKVDIIFGNPIPCFSYADKRAGALVMDMDMTSVQIEGIDEIARYMGVFDEVSQITHEAMQGKLEFNESLRRRVSKLKGGNAQEIFKYVKEHMPLTAGLTELLHFCNGLKINHRFETCIASGGFHELINVIDKLFNLSHIEANRLEVDASGHFTGNVVGKIVDAQAKADLVCALRNDGILKERIVVIGDGANDLNMMQEGGLAIAYHAKPKVQEQVLSTINYGTLTTVMRTLWLKQQIWG